MADDPTTDPKKTGKDDPKTDPDDTLGEGGKKALEAERRARRDAETKANDLQKQIDDLKNQGKDEGTKLNETVDQLRKDLESERVQRLRAEVAADKGLKPSQAKYLQGTTKEDLEASADDIAEAFPVKSAKDDEGDDEAKRRPPSRRPAADLKGGSDPTDQPTETDPAKLADSVPRL